MVVRTTHFRLFATLVAVFMLIVPVLALLGLAAPTGGRVHVDSDTELIVSTRPEGGGTIDWTVTGEAATELRRMILREYNKQNDPRDNTGPTLQLDEVNDFTEDVEDILEDDVTFFGATINSANPASSAQGQSLTVSDVRGLVETTATSTEPIIIYFHFDVQRMEREGTLRLVNNAIAQVLFDVFPNAGFDSNSDQFFHNDETYEPSRWHRTQTESHSGNYAWWCGSNFTGIYVNNSNDAMNTTIDLTLAQQPVLNFWTKHTLRTGDYGVVEVDDGTGWTKVHDINGTSGNWVPVNVSLQAFTGSAVRLRFRFVSDSGGVDLGWYVDDISVFEGNDVDLFHTGFEDLAWAQNWTINANPMGQQWSQYQNVSVTAAEGAYWVSSSPLDLYEPGSDVRMIYNDTFDLRNVWNATLSFSLLHGFYDNSDYGVIEASWDGGTNWEEVIRTNVDGVQYRNYSAGNPWPGATLSFNNYTGNESVKFRFRLRSNATGQSWGWWIDDVAFNVEYNDFFVDDAELSSALWVRDDVAYSGDYWVQTYNADVVEWYIPSDQTYANNLDNTLTTPVLDLSFVKDSQLFFEYRGSSLVGDDLVLEVSRNYSQVWEPLGFTADKDVSDWTEVNVPLTAYLGSSVQIRFRFTSDGSGVSTGYGIRQFRVAGTIYDGEYSHHHWQFYVGLNSFQKQNIEQGKFWMIRTPAGELIIYDVTWSYNDTLTDTVGYSSFNAIENPQIIFTVVFILVSLITYFPKSFLNEYRATIPARYRITTEKVKSIHFMATLFALILFVFYFLAGIGGLFISGIYLYAMGGAFIVISYAVSRSVYRKKTDEEMELYEKRQKALARKEAERAKAGLPKGSTRPVNIAIAAMPTAAEKRAEARTTQCQTCGEIFPMPPEGYEKVICPACGSVATEKKALEQQKKEDEVEAHDIEIYHHKVECPKCQKDIEVENEEINELTCPGCGYLLKVIPKQLEKGFNYLVMDHDPKTAYAIFSSLISEEQPGLCISTSFPAKLRREHGLEHAEVLWLSDTSTDQTTLDPKRLEFEITRTISKFVKEHEGAVMMLDGMEYLVIENGFEKVLKFLKKTSDMASMNQATIVVPISPNAFSEDEMTVLKKEFDTVEDISGDKEKHRRKALGEMHPDMYDRRGRGRGRYR